MRGSQDSQGRASSSWPVSPEGLAHVSTGSSRDLTTCQSGDRREELTVTTDRAEQLRTHPAYLEHS